MLIVSRLYQTSFVVIYLIEDNWISVTFYYLLSFSFLDGFWHLSEEIFAQDGHLEEFLAFDEKSM